MRVKQILLIDAVTWAPEYPKRHELRSVEGWFRKGLGKVDGFELSVCHIDDKKLDRALDRDVHGVIISGSPRDAWDNEESTVNLLAFVRSCLINRIPILGVCYGHQILARFLKAPVGRHPEGLQLGNTEIKLNSTGSHCALFKGLPDSFTAISGHADYVAEPPPNCQLLASSKHTQVEAFNFQDLFFGVQFHPEFTKAIIQFLWIPRIEAWKDRVSFSLKSRIEQFKDPSPTQIILQNFVKHYAK